MENYNNKKREDELLLYVLKTSKNKNVAYIMNRFENLKKMMHLV